MGNLLVAENVRKNYGKYTALNDISIAVPKESIFGLLGPNGAGKTTFIRIINQITMPDSGRVLLDGEPLQARHVQYIGYLPEERGLYKSMKVGEQALYLAQLKGLSKSVAKERLKYWFERLEIGNWWDKKIEELSKGMAQKVQFIVTVLHNPKLLIFDEPFSGFDPVNANLIKREIQQLRIEGATVIFSTHRMESVEEICDHIALIHNANKVLDGRLRDIRLSYKSNTFEIGLRCEDEERLTFDLREKFEVSGATFKSLTDDMKIKVKIGKRETPNDLLSYLLPRAEVTHFMELIPSVNEIFIQTVAKNNKQ